MQIKAQNQKLIALFLIALTTLAIPSLISPEGMPNNLSYLSSAEEIVAVFGGDTKHYLENADDLFTDGVIDDWHPSIFPPGMAVIWGLGIEAFGSQNLMLYSIAFTCVFMTIALWLVFISLPTSWNFWIRIAIVLSFWSFFSFRDWILGVGTAYSESKAAPFQIMSFASLALAIFRDSTRWAAAAGAFMAISTYLRVYHNTQGIFLFGLVAAGLTLALFIKTRLNTSGLKSSLHVITNELRFGTSSIRQTLVVAVLAFAVFAFLVTPWKYRNLQDSRIQSFDMGPAHYHMTFWNLWLPSEKLPEFIIGGNSACIADPELCRILEPLGPSVSDRIRRNAALVTLATRPLAWYRHRAGVFGEFWIDYHWHELTENLSLHKIKIALEGLIVLLMGLMTLVLGVRWGFQFKNPQAFGIAWFGVAMFVQNFIMYTFAGMDYRHSLPVRVGFFFFAIWLIAAIQPKKLSDLWKSTST